MTALTHQQSQREYKEADGSGVIIGILFLILAALLFLIFGVPYFQAHMPQSTYSSFSTPDSPYTSVHQGNVLVPHQPV